MKIPAKWLNTRVQSTPKEQPSTCGAIWRRHVLKDDPWPLQGEIMRLDSSTSARQFDHITPAVRPTPWRSLFCGLLRERPRSGRKCTR
jgi:hypothetical protein